MRNVIIANYKTTFNLFLYFFTLWKNIAHNISPEERNSVTINHFIILISFFSPSGEKI